MDPTSTERSNQLRRDIKLNMPKLELFNLIPLQETLDIWLLMEKNTKLNHFQVRCYPLLLEYSHFDSGLSRYVLPLVWLIYY